MFFVFKKQRNLTYCLTIPFSVVVVIVNFRLHAKSLVRRSTMMKHTNRTLISYNMIIRGNWRHYHAHQKNCIHYIYTKGHACVQVYIWLNFVCFNLFNFMTFLFLINCILLHNMRNNLHIFKSNYHYLGQMSRIHFLLQILQLQSKLLIGLVSKMAPKNEITQMKKNTNTWQ
jgi:hypothetical protein